MKLKSNGQNSNFYLFSKKLKLTASLATPTTKTISLTVMHNSSMESLKPSDKIVYLTVNMVV